MRYHTAGRGPSEGKTCDKGYLSYLLSEKLYSPIAVYYCSLYLSLAQGVLLVSAFLASPSSMASLTSSSSPALHLWSFVDSLASSISAIEYYLDKIRHDATKRQNSTFLVCNLQSCHFKRASKDALTLALCIWHQELNLDIIWVCIYS
jgi:hypothetical protein